MNDKTYSYFAKLIADSVKYLGDKFSNSRVELYLTSQVIKKLQNIDYRQINLLIKELKDIGFEQNKSNESLISSLKSLEECVKKYSTNKGSTDNKPMVLALDRLNRSLSTLSQKDDSKETEKILTALSKVEKAVNNIEIEVGETDVTSVEKQLESLRKDIKDYQQILIKSFEKMAENIGALPKTFNFPKEFKLDQEQLRSIRSNGGGVVSVNGDLKTATNWTVAIVSMASANTEYSYTFPNNTQSWTMKLRTPGQSLFYSSATGKLPVSGNNTTYMTMLPLGTRSQDNVEWSGKTIYFESDGASQVVEIEVFTL